MSDYTEDEIEYAFQMVAMGADFDSVVEKMFPDAEYPVLMAMTLATATHAWCKRQMPERLIELAGIEFTH